MFKTAKEKEFDAEYCILYFLLLSPTISIVLFILGNIILDITNAR